MRRFSKILGLLLFAMVMISNTGAFAATIDFNQFYADSSVTVAADGSWALMEEDMDFLTILLSNDPFFEDPPLPFPVTPFILSFDYEFIVGAGNYDDFYVKLFDSVSGDVIKEFFLEHDNRPNNVDWIKTGAVTWNLSGSPVGGYGLEFQLNAMDDAADSSVYLANLNYAPQPIPEPSALLLLGLGFLGLAGIYRK